MRNEWAASAFALLGVALLLATIWAGIDYHLMIRTWLSENLLVNGLLLGAGTLADVLMIFSLLCLGFSECDETDRNCKNAYRGRRSSLFPEILKVVDAVGQNPRRRSPAAYVRSRG